MRGKKKGGGRASPAGQSPQGTPTSGNKRRLFGRKKHDSSSTMASSFSLTQEEAAVVVQRHARGLVQRKKYTGQKQEKAAIKIQKIYRGSRDRSHPEYLAMKQRMEELKADPNTEAAVIRIQSGVRGRAARKRVKELRENTFRPMTGSHPPRVAADGSRMPATPIWVREDRDYDKIELVLPPNLTDEELHGLLLRKIKELKLIMRQSEAERLKTWGEDQYKVLIMTVQHIVKACNKLGPEYLKKGKSEIGLSLLNESRTLTSSKAFNIPKRPQLRAFALSELAAHYFRLGKPHAAVSYLQNIVLLDGVNLKRETHIGAFVKLAAVLSSVGKHEDAIDKAGDALALIDYELSADPGDDEEDLNCSAVVCYYNIAVERMKIGQYSAAMKELKQAFWRAQKTIPNEHGYKMKLQQAMRKCLELMDEDVKPKKVKKVKKKKLQKHQLQAGLDSPFNKDLITNKRKKKKAGTLPPGFTIGRTTANPGRVSPLRSPSPTPEPEEDECFHDGDDERRTEGDESDRVSEGEEAPSGVTSIQVAVKSTQGGKKKMTSGERKAARQRIFGQISPTRHNYSFGSESPPSSLPSSPNPDNFNNSFKESPSPSPTPIPPRTIRAYVGTKAKIPEEFFTPIRERAESPMKSVVPPEAVARAEKEANDTKLPEIKSPSERRPLFRGKSRTLLYLSEKHNPRKVLADLEATDTDRSKNTDNPIDDPQFHAAQKKTWKQPQKLTPLMPYIGRTNTVHLSKVLSPSSSPSPPP